MLFGRHINKYYIKYMPALLLGASALFAVDYFQLKIPELYKYIIDGINDGFVAIDGVSYTFDFDFVLDFVCRPMLVVVFAIVIGRFLWRICLFGSAVGVEADIRSKMFERSLSLSQQYYQKNKVGGMMSLFTNDLDTINECFGDGVLMAVDAALLGTLAIYKMTTMDGILTLLSMIPMVFMLVIATIVGKSMNKKWAARQAAFSSLSDFSQESFSGIAVIKAFVKELSELLAFGKLNRDNEEKNIEFTKISTLLHVFVTLFVESVICVILGYGGYLVYRDAFTPGELIEFMSYFSSVVWPVMAISQLIEMRSRGAASLGRIGELLDAPTDVADEGELSDIDKISGDIEYRNLTFRYPGAEYDALTGVSFKISAGESVCIIGRTGSGKTTLVDLLMRIYNVPRGTLFVDGRDMNEIPIKTLRAHAAYVPQDNFLFSDTIENNIAFAEDSFTEGEVERAAALAALDGNIAEFPNKYKTILGERGVTVSGGQKQRISIARALMKRAEILVLDDSVSAVDTDTERIIIDNLKKERAGKTTILIAHRVSTARQMDKIIFLSEGRVLAVGTHDELIECCPEYRLTVELQRLEEEKKNA